MVRDRPRGDRILFRVSPTFGRDPLEDPASGERQTASLGCMGNPHPWRGLARGDSAGRTTTADSRRSLVSDVCNFNRHDCSRCMALPRCHDFPQPAGYSSGGVSPIISRPFAWLLHPVQILLAYLICEEPIGADCGSREQERSWLVDASGLKIPARGCSGEPFRREPIAPISIPSGALLRYPE